MDVNRRQNSTSKKMAFKTLLEPSWACLWVILGSILGSKIIKIHFVLEMFRENDIFEEDNAWKCILGRTWVGLVAKKDPKWFPDWTQNGAKLASKNNRKVRSVWDRS